MALLISSGSYYICRGIGYIGFGSSGCIRSGSGINMRNVFLVSGVVGSNLAVAAAALVFVVSILLDLVVETSHVAVPYR